jgi:hypothetical protein
MPPKSPVKSAHGSDSGMDQENAFLAMCLRNIDPDSKKVRETERCGLESR